MGLMDRIFGLLFGGGANVLRDTAEVFVENREKAAVRGAVMHSDALAQYGREFGLAQRGVFDRLMDALNRLPRPALALGTLGLFTAAMVDPIWFASRMQGIALVPEPLWWLLAAVVSFYFGARHQVKHQQFQTQVAASLALAPQVLQNLDALHDLRPTPESASTPSRIAPSQPSQQNYPDNAALREWAATM